MRHQTPEVEDPQNQGWVTLWTLALLLSSLVFVHGILQARTLEWLAISSSRTSSPPRDQALVSCISCNDRQILYH